MISLPTTAQRAAGFPEALPRAGSGTGPYEDYVKFERKEAEYGGAWAMATFIEATETFDEAKRKELMDKIAAYNREDLEATWAVFQWLNRKISTPSH